jgi:DNA-directed RNA polymerase specialized sigma24 family protein
VKNCAKEIDKEPPPGQQKARKSPGKSSKGKSAALNPHPRNRESRPAVASFPLSWLPLPKDIALIDDRLMLLHKAIDQLPKSQRQALDLAVYGGRSEAEIAVEIGEPLGKAQRSLRAAITFVKHRRRAVSGTWAANI